MSETTTARAAAALASQGKIAEAKEALDRLVAAGDAEAMYLRAIWHAEGKAAPRDLVAARDLFGRAGEAGHALGGVIHMNFVANGTGGPRDWPAAIALLRAAADSDAGLRAQLDTLEAMALTDAGDPQAVATGETLSETPSVRLVPGLFSEAEGAYLIAAAQPRFAPSFVVDRQGRRLQHPTRTSDVTSFPWAIEDLVVHALNRRLAAISDTEATQGEPLQILRYRAGQQYKPHFDAVSGLENQRVLTVLVYLTDDFDGGETVFPKADLEIRPRRGDALLFRNTTADGSLDDRSLHAGRPVTRGVKIIASRWIRARRFELVPPRPTRRA